MVPYGVGNSHSPDPRLRSAQFTGTAHVAEVTTTELELLGPGPHSVDGEAFDPVSM